MNRSRWARGAATSGLAFRSARGALAASLLSSPTLSAAMHLGHLQYLPLSLPFFSMLAGLFALLVLLLQIGALRYAYSRLGISAGGAMLLLLASLIGSYFNIPIAELPAERIVSGREIVFFGMHYVVPVVVASPGTIIAINVGGAVIPGITSLLLLSRHHLWGRGLVAVAIVAAVVHALATPVHGLGIAVPIFLPAIVTAVVAVLLSRRQAAPLAYVGGCMGTLVGADLLNLGRIGGLGAPVASIGGAGTFDGVFVTGVLAVLFAGISGNGGEPNTGKRR